MSKVFGIGLSKTGTTSLAAALTELGYRTRHYVDTSIASEVVEQIKQCNYRLPGLGEEVDAWVDTMAKLTSLAAGSSHISLQLLLNDLLVA
ncbi:MAG: hypothetical protein OEU36_05585 [Gammaproteobacteria bacterium]|nr:hypothetical protein [Gammaproteobacteria bacterium]